MTQGSDDFGGNWERLLAELRNLFSWEQSGRRAEEVEPKSPISPSASHELYEPPARGVTGVEPVDIIIGLDFGTSSTKVVVRTPYHHGGWAEAIDFGEHAHESCKYLIPTSLCCEKGGAVTLASDRTRHRWNDLKIRLLDVGDHWCSSHDELEAVALASGYLGLVIRFVRQAFLAKHHDSFGTSIRRWWLNVGMPSAGYDDERVRKLFQAAAEAGWVLSTETATVGVALGVASEALEGTLGADRVSVIPEVVAEVAGYARSSRRDPGLHLLVDVGASTLDVCGFVLHDHGSGDRYELLTALVKRLGALELHRRRIEKVGGAESLPPGVPGDLPGDLVEPIPDTPEEYCGSRAYLIESLREVDQTFQKECRVTTMEVVVPLKKRRDPNSSRWKEGLPVFLCGGAAELAVIRDSLLRSPDLEQGLASIGTCFRFLPAPALANLVNNDVDDALVRRLGVAFGLSFDREDIGTITPPRDIEDIPPRRLLDWRSDYIDKDRV